MQFRQGTTLTRKDPLKSLFPEKSKKSIMQAARCNSNNLRASGLSLPIPHNFFVLVAQLFHTFSQIRFFYITVKITKKVNGCDGSNANNPNIPSLRRDFTPNDLHVPKTTWLVPILFLLSEHVSGFSLSIPVSLPGMCRSSFKKQVSMVVQQTSFEPKHFL